MATAEAEIVYTEAYDESREKMRKCVIAICQESFVETEPIWGQSPALVKRALATLTEDTCICGNDFHRDMNASDDD